MERTPEELQRPDGRHPARTRRKRKRKRALQATTKWETETYWNMLTLPTALSSSALFASALFVPVIVPALKAAPSCLITTVMLSLLAVVLTLPMHTTLFLHWNVSLNHISATQPGRGASMTRGFENQGFESLSVRGPFAIIRHTSGQRHIWPRWLRSKRITYQWRLHEGRLTLHSSIPNSLKLSLITVISREV